MSGHHAEESLMQLAGHLRGRALQEWKLLLPEDKITYQAAVRVLKERLDPGNQTLAALDFRHTSQRMNESVSDFIGRLERVFQTGFGREHLSKETREMLLYGQLQEGLLYVLTESPAVSGAQNYKELCLAAKREERRLAELKKKQQYLKSGTYHHNIAVQQAMLHTINHLQCHVIYGEGMKGFSNRNL